MGRTGKVALGLGLIALGVLAIIGLIKFGSLLAFALVYPYALSEITGFGLNPYIAKIIAVFIAIGLLFAFKYVFSWKAKNRHIGYGLFGLYFIVHCLAMYFTTKDKFFSHTGEPIKYCCRDSISNKWKCDDARGYCQDGTKKQTITAEIVKEIKAEEMSNAQNMKSATMEIPCWEVTNWFDLKDGHALIYYEENSAGSFHCFVESGYSPYTRKKLKAVDASIVGKIKVFANTQRAYYDRPKTKDNNELSFAQNVRNSIRIGIGNAVNYFKTDPTLIFILLLIINILPWIITLFYTEFADEIVKSNTVMLLAILATILLNVFLFPIFHHLVEICFILWLISVAAFGLFVLCWFFAFNAFSVTSAEAKVVVSAKVVVHSNSSDETKVIEYRRRRAEYERRRQEFLNGSA